MLVADFKRATYEIRKHFYYLQYHIHFYSYDEGFELHQMKPFYMHENGYVAWMDSHVENISMERLIQQKENYTKRLDEIKEETIIELKKAKAKLNEMGYYFPIIEESYPEFYELYGCTEIRSHLRRVEKELESRAN